MNPFSPINVIHTGKDGILKATTTAEIDASVAEIAKTGKAVWHFHGGLVPKDKGIEGARRLHETCYGPTGSHTIFFVWESGLIESIKHNWTEIFNEEFFQRLLNWLLKYAAGKVAETVTAKGLGAQLPKELEHQMEMKKPEPYGDIIPTAEVSDLSATEEKDLEARILADSKLADELMAILASTQSGEQVAPGAKGLDADPEKSAKTLMSPARLEELQQGFVAADASAKGIISAKALLKVAKAAVVILKRVIRRFQQGRDHGLYTTVVEELMREYYLANVGATVWGFMKKDTHDTFEFSAKIRGGHYLLTRFAELLKAGHRPEITLVGHSTGAVFINHLLNSFAARRAAEGWPMDFKFKNICFLAPACRMDNFASTATDNRGLFENFRMFTMTDAYESKDQLLGPIYPRSLLYAISGVLEEEQKDDKTVSASDMPILGMERYLKNPKTYPAADFPDVETARQMLASAANQAVWSVAQGNPAGLNSASEAHGDFDNEDDTLASLRAIIG